MPVRDDFIDKRFGLWKIIDIADDYIEPKTGYKKKRYLCECQCENKTKKVVLLTLLKNGISTNCGCVKKQKLALRNSQTKKKHNKYNLDGDYGIGYLSSGEEFYFDLEDYDKIKNYYWNKNKGGYIVSNVNNCEVALHLLVMDRLKVHDGLLVDHIGGEQTRCDARKYNLRVCSRSNNAMNRRAQSNNKSGYPGIYYDKNIKKYKVSLTVNRKQMYFGCFDEIELAIKARKEAEEKYFGEYSYDNSIRYAKERKDG